MSSGRAGRHLRVSYLSTSGPPDDAPDKERHVADQRPRDLDADELARQRPEDSDAEQAVAEAALSDPNDPPVQLGDRPDEPVRDRDGGTEADSQVKPPA
ncbi:hypothetical protein FTX61_10785 [Nitriliruptoraceae bacterium ZYF776]|nr:hypothetical protein [Profundirhabdus halotolerans]